MAPDSKLLSEREVEGIVIISVNQGLKGQCEMLLRERLDALTRQGRGQILIDLKLLPYLDSTDLGRVIRAHNAVRQAGGRVRLCNLSEKIMTLMNLTRLNTVLDLYSTEEEALAAMRSSASS
jgi:anti-anti-sigma factor